MYKELDRRKISLQNQAGSVEHAAMESLEERAEKAEESGDLTTALPLWKELAQSDRDPVAFTRYGCVAQELERWVEAEIAFNEALRIDPSFTLAMESMGDLWATRTDRNETESFQTAKQWFLKALRRDRNSRTLTFLGATYKALGDEAQARDAFAEAVRLNPNSPGALYNLGVSEAETDRRGSIDLLERAIDADPNHFHAHQELGKLLHKEGDLPRAEYHFRRSLEIEPTDIWSLLNLANNLAVQGKLHEAEQTYRLATKLHPEDKVALEYCADFLESIGKNEAAAAVRAKGGSTAR